LLLAVSGLDVGPLGDLYGEVAGDDLQSARRLILVRTVLFVVHVEVAEQDFADELIVPVGEVLRSRDLSARPLHLLGDVDVAGPPRRSLVPSPPAEQRLRDDDRALLGRRLLL